MMDEEYVSRIKLAVELATKKIMAIHRKVRDENEDRNEIYQYESLFRAMVYHELILLGIYFGDITMDNPINSDKEGLKNKKPDIWIKNTFALEIKIIRHDKKENIIKQIHAEKKDSIIEDIVKLSKAVDDLEIKGIMILSHQSPNFSGDEDPVDIMEKEIRKIVRKIKPPESVILVLCSEESCKVLKVKEILRG